MREANDVGVCDEDDGDEPRQLHYLTLRYGEWCGCTQL